jgi:acyl-CoA hydrolase
VQAVIGSVPNEVLKLLRGQRELDGHTELLADGFVDLIEHGAVTGPRKRTNRNRTITTWAIGSQRFYDFLADNPGVEFWPG